MTLLQNFQHIKAFAFDIDGVLTNGTLLITENGSLLRQMNIKDGYALQLAIKKGYPITIISGGNSDQVKTRLQKLGINDIYLRVEDKKETLIQWAHSHNISLQHILYMGDDLPDLQAMKIVGLPTCPKDAASEILTTAQYISTFKGGEACVRDVIEKVLKLNHHWE